MLLAAGLLRHSGDTGINAAAIVDKRVFVLPQTNPTVVTSTPGSAVGAIGEIRIDSNMTPGHRGDQSLCKDRRHNVDPHGSTYFGG